MPDVDDGSTGRPALAVTTLFVDRLAAEYEHKTARRWSVESFATSRSDVSLGAETMFNYPILLSLVLLFVLWLAAQFGVFVSRRRTLTEDEREDFGIVQAATLTLLGLVIGFSFSMAVSRYDQRKNYEEEEANAIGTEYFRAGLLPAANAAGLRALLRKYLDLRVLSYKTRSGQELRKIDADTAQVQTEMWSAVQASALAQPTPVVALATAGVNDVLNSQGYTQAAWLNRIPIAAWGLMIAIAISCNFLVGYGIHNAKGRARLLFVLPLVVSISFLLIADIDSPRGGLIHVVPENLINLSQSLASQ